jgi:hypothetical protein
MGPLKGNMKAYRIWNPKTQLRFYVAELPGPKGVPDWGYTSDPKQAMDLTPYWARRFASHCQKMETKAVFVK